MAPELFKVHRIDDWPSTTGGKTLWVIKGETVEEHPRWVTLKTTNALHASVFDRFRGGVWVTWLDTYRSDPWVRTVVPDTSRFQHQEAV